MKTVNDLFLHHFDRVIYSFDEAFRPVKEELEVLVSLMTPGQTMALLVMRSTRNRESTDLGSLIHSPDSLGGLKNSVPTTSPLNWRLCCAQKEDSRCLNLRQVLEWMRCCALWQRDDGNSEEVNEDAER